MHEISTPNEKKPLPPPAPNRSPTISRVFKTGASFRGFWELLANPHQVSKFLCWRRCFCLLHVAGSVGKSAVSSYFRRWGTCDGFESSTRLRVKPSLLECDGADDAMFKQCSGCVCTIQARVVDNSSLLDVAPLVVCHHVMLAIHGELRALTGSPPFSRRVSEHRFLTSASLHSGRTFLAHQWLLGTSVETSAGTTVPVDRPRIDVDSTESPAETPKRKCATTSTGSFTIFAAVVLFNDRSDADNSIFVCSASNPSHDLVGGECAPRRQLWFGGGGKKVLEDRQDLQGVLSIIRSGRQEGQKSPSD